MKLIKGSEIAQKEIYPSFEKGSFSKNKVAVFYNPRDKMGIKYVEIKKKKGGELGIKFNLYPYQSFKKDLEIIKKLNQDKKIIGIILQLSLPKDYSPELIYSLNPDKDVDGLFSKFYLPPVVLAVKRALDEIPLWQEKKILVVGQGEYVGKKIYHYLRRFAINCQAVNNPKAADLLIPKYEIIISCVGKPGIINEHNFKGMAVIDVGTMVEKGKIKGDAKENLKNKAQFFTPVPGGIGPLTIAYLMENIKKAEEKQNNL